MSMNNARGLEFIVNKHTPINLVYRYMVNGTDPVKYWLHERNNRFNRVLYVLGYGHKWGHL